ncbi:MAG: OmpA family protein [Pseudomonadota bacterium]
MIFRRSTDLTVIILYLFTFLALGLVLASGQLFTKNSAYDMPSLFTEDKPHSEISLAPKIAENGLDISQEMQLIQDELREQADILDDKENDLQQKNQHITALEKLLVQAQENYKDIFNRLSEEDAALNLDKTYTQKEIPQLVIGSFDRILQARDEKLQSALLKAKQNSEATSQTTSEESLPNALIEKMEKIASQHKALTAKGNRFILAQKPLFAIGTRKISQQGYKSLRSLVSALKALLKSEYADKISIRIDGHTDIIKPKDNFITNRDLSALRALRVVEYLEKQGIPANKLIAAAFGEHSPVSKGNTAKDLAKNRRIEVTIIPIEGEL